MRHFYWTLLRQAPFLLVEVTDRIYTVSAALLFLLFLLNRQLGEWVLTTWEGFSPWFALVPVGVLMGYALLKANYTRFWSIEQERDELRTRLSILESQVNRQEELEAALRRGEAFAVRLANYRESLDLKYVVDFYEELLMPFAKWVKETAGLLPAQDRLVFIRGDHMQFPNYFDTTYDKTWGNWGAEELLVHVNYCRQILRNFLNRL